MLSLCVYVLDNLPTLSISSVELVNMMCWLNQQNFSQKTSQTNKMISVPVRPQHWLIVYSDLMLPTQALYSFKF